MADLSGRCTNRTRRNHYEDDGRCLNEARHRVVCDDCGGFFANLCDDCAEEMERVYNRFGEPAIPPTEPIQKAEPSA